MFLFAVIGIFPFSFSDLFLFSVYECFACMHSAQHVPGSQGGQIEGATSLELELQVLSSPQPDARIESGSSERTASVLNP